MKRMFALLVLALVLLPATALAATAGDTENVVSFGHSVTVGPNETATGVVVFGGSANMQGTDLGDLAVFGGSATVDGPVTGNVVVFGGSPVINNRVGGNLVVFGGTAHLQDGAEIMGDVFSIGGSTERTGNAVVHGSISSGFGLFGGWHFLSGAFDVWRLFSAIFLGLIFFWLFPLATNRAASAVVGNPAKAALAGFVGYLAIVPAIILLALTLIGIPFIPIFLLAILVARLFGQVALALLAGKWIISRFQSGGASEWILVVLGLLGLGLISLIPVVGVFASLFYSLVGFGGVILTRFGTRSVVA